MSQPFQTTGFKRNYWPPYPNHGYSHRTNRGKGYYENSSGFSYKYQGRRPWSFNRRKIKRVQRSPSPFSGTEEYTLKKIEETSEMIKKKLLMPDDETDEVKPPAEREDNKVDNNQPVLEVTSDKIGKRKASSNSKQLICDTQDFQERLISHLSNLNHRRKVNLICGASSGYDNAIEQIQKQRRLEISKALREMCSNQSVENCEAKIHSIIPDFGLKIENLPLEVIAELSNTLNLDSDSFSLLTADGESNSAIFDLPMLEIKTEVNENSTSDIDLLSETERQEKSHKGLDNRSTNAENVRDQIFISKDVKLETPLHFFPPFSSKESSMTQTEAILQMHITTQTDNFENRIQEISSLKDAVDVMLEIDKEIQRLTNLRQSIFFQLEKQENGITKEIFQKTNGPKRKTNKLKKIKTKKTLCCRYEKALEFGDLKEKVLIMQVFEETIIAGCESGNLLFINTKTGSINSLTVTNVSITCLATWANSQKQLQLYVGAFDATLYNYSYPKKQLQHKILVGESVQCVDLAWNLIFVGTNGGFLKRYCTKGSCLEFEERISEHSIFVLKATQEGARKVILVGSRNVPVTVRDAMSGLHLRTMTDFINPTVYCLILENSMLYCGTSNNDLLVFRFHDGCLVRKHQATFAKGISCMKIVNDLLFASCHNGNIYVYDSTSQTYVGKIEGPGGVILSMEIITNLVVVGTMSLKLQSILIPDHILQWKRSDG